MLRCSPEAFAKCPTRKLCGSIQDATFTEDSECARFNQSVDARCFTNADRIRAMSDEDLTKFINRILEIGDISELFCKNKQECIDLIDSDTGIPQEWCDKCLLEWLCQPAEEECYDT